MISTRRTQFNIYLAAKKNIIQNTIYFLNLFRMNNKIAYYCCVLEILYAKIHYLLRHRRKNKIRYTIMVLNIVFLQ